MAEYLPLLERAVAGLAPSTPETRRAIYERARGALLGHLRSMDPPVPEEDVERENAALDDAIRRMEASLRPPEAPAVPARPESSASSSSPLPPPPRPRASPLPPRVLPSRPLAPSAAPGLPSADAPPMVSPPVRERSSPPPRLSETSRSSTGASVQRPAAPLRPPLEAATQGAAPPVAPRPSLSARPLNTAPRVGIEPRTAGQVREPPPVVAEASPQRPADGLAALPVATPLDIARPTRGARGEGESAAEVPSFVPASEPPIERSTRGAGFYIVMAVGALLVGGVAFEAWKLRDRPEQVMAAQQQAASDQGGKVVDRAGGADESGAKPDPSGDVTIVPLPAANGSAPPPLTSSDVPQPPSAGSAPSAPMAAPVPQPSPAADPPASPTSQPAAPSVGVAERAALLVDAPSEPQKIKTYEGTVVWRTESMSAGQGQPLSQAIVAEVHIPGAKLAMTMVMKRNVEPQFPASHTIEFRFIEQAESEVGAVKQIDVPQMRLDDSSIAGDPMIGLPVAITDNNFLVGLSRGRAEAANTLMLQRRNWIDLPMLLVSGKAAKVTFEKGAPGERIIDDTLKTWQSGG